MRKLLSTLLPGIAISFLVIACQQKTDIIQAHAEDKKDSSLTPDAQEERVAPSISEETPPLVWELSQSHLCPSPHHLVRRSHYLVLWFGGETRAVATMMTMTIMAASLLCLAILDSILRAIKAPEFLKWPSRLSADIVCLPEAIFYWFSRLSFLPAERTTGFDSLWRCEWRWAPRYGDGKL